MDSNEGFSPPHSSACKQCDSDENMFSIMNMQCLTSAVLIFNRREESKEKEGEGPGEDWRGEGALEKGRKGEHRGEKKKGGKGEEKTQGN